MTKVDARVGMAALALVWTQYACDGSGPQEYHWRAGDYQRGDEQLYAGDNQGDPLPTDAMSGDDMTSGDDGPAIIITAPEHQEVVSGTVTVSAEVIRTRQPVRAVNFRVDDERSIAYLLTPPYEATWDTMQTTLGPHQLVAVATFVFSEEELRTAIDIEVADESLTVSFVSPHNDDRLSGNVDLEVTANDDNAVVAVTFAVDGLDVGIVTAPPFVLEWSTCRLADGPHTIVRLRLTSVANRAQRLSTSPLSTSKQQPPPCAAAVATLWSDSIGSRAEHLQ